MGQQSEHEAEIRDLWVKVDKGYQACVGHCFEMAELMAAGNRQYALTADATRRQGDFNAVVTAAKDKLDLDLYRAYYTISFRLCDLVAEALKELDPWSLAHSLGKTEDEVLALADLSKTDAGSREIVLAKADECFVDALSRNVEELKRAKTES